MFAGGADVFQSRNRESSNFNSLSAMRPHSWQKFQSRNRESSNFNTGEIETENSDDTVSIS